MVAYIDIHLVVDGLQNCKAKCTVIPIPNWDQHSSMYHETESVANRMTGTKKKYHSKL